jgi:hypothetical protein
LELLLALFVTFTRNLMFTWCLIFNQEWLQRINAVYKNCSYYLTLCWHNGSWFGMWLGKFQP